MMLMMFSHRLARVMNAVQEGPRRTEETVASENDGSFQAYKDELRQGRREELGEKGRGSYKKEPPFAKDNKEPQHGLPNANVINHTRNENITIVKRQRKRPRKRRQEHYLTSPAKLKVPLPIFVPSLPKSGTTSIHEYFICGNHKSAHHVYRIDGKVQNKIGRCWQRNIRHGRPALEGCGDHDIWSDTGFVGMNYRKGKDSGKSSSNIPCYYPLIESLDQIYESYPNATFLFLTRNETSWLNSIQTYHDGFIMDVWRRCRIRGFPGPDAEADDFRRFYTWHKKLIRNFAEDHPSITYLEIPLEGAETAQVLEDKIGAPRKCWGHYNKQSNSRVKF